MLYIAYNDMEDLKQERANSSQNYKKTNFVFCTKQNSAFDNLLILIETRGNKMGSHLEMWQSDEN